MSTNKIKAIDAMQEAQKIAFAPFLFQATIALRKLGIFDFIFERRIIGGVTIKEISEELSINEYGVGVLLEIAESSDIVTKNLSGKYELSTIGYFLTYNQTTEVNLNFTNDVCYKGLHHLIDAIKSGKPEGLKELGSWDTIYEGLSQLSPEVQGSWFGFDHHYSDHAFNEALKIVFSRTPKTIFDIGGNTGKFATICCNYDDDVIVTIHDLPGQINKALSNAFKNGLEERIKGYEIDWLSENPMIHNGADVIWMSQFLDCFSKVEILKILTTCVRSMNDKTELIIMETFTDRQKFKNAEFSLNATSLYFTTMANGNSKMYRSEEMVELINKAGLYIDEDLNIGEYHTLLICKKNCHIE